MGTVMEEQIAGRIRIWMQTANQVRMIWIVMMME